MSIWAQDPSQFNTVKVLKFDYSNSTLALCSGFDLYRFFHVLSLKKRNRKRSCLGQDSNPGPADQKLVMLTITPWLPNGIWSKSLSF